MFTFKYADRLELLATHISPCVQDVLDTYTRPFAEGEVRDGAGQIVSAIPPRLRQAQDQLMAEVATFEKVAAGLAAQAKTNIALLKSAARAETLNRERHERTAKEQA